MRIDQLLLAVAPRANKKFVEASVACNAAAILAKWGLSDAPSQAQIVGQLAHESGGFQHFEENLNYRAETMVKLWPRRYPTLEAAAPYAHRPREFAISCYGSRMGNRPGTSDGWDFRGSDPTQHTGRAEFERIARTHGVDVVSKPDRMRDPANAQLAWEAACSFFVNEKKCLPAMKAGQTQAVTLKLNGGTNGLSDRVELVGRAARALAGKPLDASAPTVGEVPAVMPPTPPVSRTTAEEVDATEENKKTAGKAGAGGTIASGPASSFPQGKGSASTADHWIIVGSVMLSIALVSFLVWRVFARRHDAAVDAREGQQLLGIAQKVEGSA